MKICWRYVVFSFFLPVVLRSTKRIQCNYRHLGDCWSMLLSLVLQIWHATVSYFLTSTRNNWTAEWRTLKQKDKFAHQEHNGDHHRTRCPCDCRPERPSDHLFRRTFPCLLVWILQRRPLNLLSWHFGRLAVHINLTKLYANVFCESRRLSSHCWSCWCLPVAM